MLPLLLLTNLAAAQAVPNGTFADSSGWTASGVNGGSAGLVTQGTQFSSSETTTGIVFPSAPYARNVRSSGPAPTNSVGILTSDTFVLTQSTLQWRQISERTNVTLVFRLLDSGSGQLSSVGLTPSDNVWTTQTFDASAWCGRTVRMEYRQNTLTVGNGWFSLIDDVALTGSVCSGYADTDRDGTCPNGRDLNADGDCADPGELTGPTDCAEGNSARGGLQAEVTGNDVDENCDGVASCWRDNDGDSWGAAAFNSADADCGDAGEARQPGDCDDNAAGTRPGGTELCAAGDEDCDGAQGDADPSVADRSTWYLDNDGDSRGAGGAILACVAPARGVRSGDDCDDADSQRSPLLTEVCDPVNRDEDCDGLADDADAAQGRVTVWWDGDGDGFGDPGQLVAVCDPLPGWIGTAGDCDDALPDVSPLGLETCGAGDEDCDGLFDDADPDVAGAPTWYADADLDGYGDLGAATVSCVAPPGTLADATDCDDTRADVSPSGVETCGAGDEDCDGLSDDADPSTTGAPTWYADADEDGYGDPSAATVSCVAPPGTLADAGDCDDGRDDVSPSGVETCGAGDEDCDGLSDDADPSTTGAPTWYADADEDGYGDPSAATVSCVAPPGTLADAGDCDDGRDDVSPSGVETCGAGDEDCDGLSDDADPSTTGAPTWYTDADQDGYGEATSATQACVAPPGDVPDPGDCDDGAAGVGPGAPERCDAADVDEDCDGLADDADSAALATSTFYADADGDGWGATAETISACDLAPARAAAPGDCDDLRDDVYPGAPEACDAPDADCDGLDGAADPDAADAVTRWRDDDLDGFGAGEPERVCDPGPGWATAAGDCDDASAALSPGVSELCAPGDEDCDGLEGDADAPADPSAWYADADTDGFGMGSTVFACVAPPGHVGVSGDCDDQRPDVNPDGVELCAAGDEDCDGLEGTADPGVADPLPRWRDQDGDGWGGATLPPGCELPPGAAGRPGDCDDAAANVFPGAEDLPADGVDQDCDGLAVCWADEDGDGVGGDTTTTAMDEGCDDAATVTGDCDDSDPDAFPGAPETPGAGVDADCDGALSCVLDADGDGWGAAGGIPVPATTEDCSAPGESPSADDCDDADPAIHPEAQELPGNAIDEDCSGDHMCWADADGDGWGDARAIPSADGDCDDLGEADDDGDCDDGDPTALPGGTDLAGDNVDQDCDGLYVCGLDADGDGFGSMTETGLSTSPTCDEPGVALQLSDCDDSDARVSPSGRDEVNDGVDQDCDGLYTCAADRDGDGYGSRVETVEVSDPGCAGAAADTSDCNDMDATIHPSVEDAPGDAIDADCDGVDPEPEDSDVPVDSDVETDVPEPVDTAQPTPGPAEDKDVVTEDPGGCSCATGGPPTAGWLLVWAGWWRRRARRA